MPYHPPGHIETTDDLFIVGDGDDRRLLLDRELAKEVHHYARPLGIERSRRLVREDDPRPVGQRLSGIMGPNGAGKTTCFNVLTGRYKPDRGKVIFDGQNITGRSPHAIARRGIARSFQLMNLFDDYSALENVLLTLPEVRRRGLDCWRPLLDDRAACERAMQVLRDVGLAERALEPARRLAYGERRALEIGLALAARPKILFLDEPTAGLGMAGTARLLDLVLAGHGAERLGQDDASS